MQCLRRATTVSRGPHWGLVLFLGAVSAQPAWGEETAELPTGLGDLPSSTPVALYIPRLGDLISDIQHLHPALGALHPGLRGLSPARLVPWLLWGFEARRAGPSKPHGLDLEGPMTVRLDPTLNAAVVTLPLREPEVFRGWLEALPAPSRNVVDLGGINAYVFAPDSRKPLSCVVQPQEAYCQVGVPSTGGAVAPLEAQLRPGRLQLGDVEGMGQAWSSLAGSPRWTALVRPVLLARGLARYWGRGMKQAHRLHTQTVRREVAQRAKDLERRAVTHARSVRAVAASIEANEAGVRAQVVVRLSDAGRTRLTRWLPERSVHSRIRPWTATPSLLSLFVQAKPGFAAELVRWAGLNVPAETLDGVLGLIAVGVDVHCPQATSPHRGSLDWAFLFPSALSVGLRNPGAAERVYDALAPHLASEPSVAVERRPRLTGTVGGGPLQVYVLDDVLIAGTGPMGGYAGLRRLRALDAQIPEVPDGFLHAVVDVGAFDAALGGAGAVGRKHRAELRWVDSMRRRLAPFIRAIHRIELSGVREDEGRQVRLELAFGR